jgi:hypothetical protein
MTNRVRALSLWRPWPHTILHLDKRIENRGHNRYRKFRGPLLLHAAQKWDSTCHDWCDERGLLPVGVGLHHVSTWWVDQGRVRRTRVVPHPTGIVGRCWVVGHVEPFRDDRGIVVPIVVVGPHELAVDPFGLGATVVSIRRNGERVPELFVHAKTMADVAFAQALDLRWWMGGHALILADVEALPEAIPCRGHRGIWPVPNDVVAQLPESWRTAA